MQATFPHADRFSPLRSALTFAATIALGISYWLHPASRAVQEPLERFLALTTGTFLGWFDSSVSVTHTTIGVGAFVANVVPACTGLFTMTLYAAAVLATPCPLRHKARGVLGGVLAILALNWVRIVSLLLIGAHWLEAFEFAHLVVWQSVALVFAVFAWLFWLQRLPHGR